MQTNTPIHSGLIRRTSTVLTLSLCVWMAMGDFSIEKVGAASSWGPALLVNTESFQVIDDADTSANVVLRFGETINKSLTYNRSLLRFQFDDDLYVQGNAEATGTFSGTTIFAQRALRSSGSLVWEGAGSGKSIAISGTSSLVGNVNIGTMTAATVPLEVWAEANNATVRTIFSGTPVTNGGGGSFQGLLRKTPTAADQRLGDTSFGAYDSAGVVRLGALIRGFAGEAWGNLASRAAYLTLETTPLSSTTREERMRITTEGNVGIGSTAPETKLEVVGSVSGSVLYGNTSVRSSGSLVFEGAASGSSLYLGTSLEGAGLQDCDTSGTSKLLWDATAKRFSCGTDQTGGGTTIQTVTNANASATDWGYTVLVTTGAANRTITLPTAAGNTGEFIEVKKVDSGTGTITIDGFGSELIDTSSNVTILNQHGSITFRSDGTNVRRVSDNLSGAAPPSTSVIVGGVQGASLAGIYSIAVAGRYAYTANYNDDSLRIIDVSNPAAPVFVGVVQDATNLDGVNAVAVAGRYAYVTNNEDDSLRIIDVSNPAAPVIVGGVKDATNLDGANAVAIAGRYAYVANSTDDSLRIIDVSNPAAPVIVGGVKDATNLDAARSVAVAGRYAYVASFVDDSLRIIDVSNPTAPVIVGGVKDATNLDGITSVAIAGRYAYVANNIDDSLRIIDVSNPAAPVIVGGVQDATNLDAARSVAVSGRYAYVVNNTDNSLRIIDVSNPAAPVIVAGVKDATNLSGPISVTVSGRYAYVANFGTPSVRIVDIGGTELSTLQVSALEAGSIQSKTDMIAQGQVRGDSIMAGAGGLQAQGQSAIFAQSGSALVLRSQNAGANPILKAFGTISGSALRIDGNADVHGTLTASGQLIVDGNLTFGDAIGDAITVNAGAWTFANDTNFALSGGVNGLSFDTNTLSIDAQNDRIGIGTTAPETTLEVLGSMSGKSLVISGSGAVPLVTTDITRPALRIGGSGMLLLGSRSDPGSLVPANTVGLYGENLANRTMAMVRNTFSGAANPLQPSLFNNMIMTLTTGGGTTVNGYGTTVTNDTTVSHPAADQTFGYMTNFATTTTSGDEAGTSSANTTWFRGSTTGANGFFFAGRVGVVDTTSIRVYAGMADQTIATMVGADNPAGNHIGFQFSTARGDTNWQFRTKDNTTANVVNTGVAFTANKVYDLMFFCEKQCSTVTWEIRNVTDGTSATGTTGSNLPTTSTAVRIVLGVETQTTAAKNIRMQQLYVEADR